MANNTATHLLGTEKISTLLWQYALPSIIAMTAASLYNMVDTIFIGHGVGPMGNAALTIALPLMNIAAAFGAMVGAGASSLLSIKLGQKDNDSARHILGNVVMLNLILGISLGVISIIFLDPILIAFGASETVLPYAREYMLPLLYGNVVTHLYMGLNNTMRAAGHPQKSMMVMLIAVGVNCALDAFFIFVLDWGIAGAAWATVIAQVVALIIELDHFFNKKHELHFVKGIFKLKKRIVKGILGIGLAPFLMNLASSMIVAIINWRLGSYGGDLYIGAYGNINKLALIFFMIVLGLNQGMQPIVGYNYGALKFDRVRQAFMKVVVIATCIMSVGFVISVFFPGVVSRIFTSDEALIKATEEGLWIVFLMYPVVGFQIVSSSMFQSIGKPGKAILLSLTRQLLFLLPMLIILPPIFGTDGVWMSMPIADISSTVLAVVLIVNQLRKFKQQENTGKLV